MQQFMTVLWRILRLFSVPIRPRMAYVVPKLQNAAQNTISSSLWLRWCWMNLLPRLS